MMKKSFQYVLGVTVVESLFYTDLFAHIVVPHEINDEAAPLLLCCPPG